MLDGGHALQDSHADRQVQPLEPMDPEGEKNIFIFLSTILEVKCHETCSPTVTPHTPSVPPFR
jgi:hypothetical protein